MERKIVGHRKLEVWKKGMAFAKTVYQVTDEFPSHELYSLSKQLRRAVVSMPSNVAEGYGRNSRSELHQFIGIARGSLSEVETQLELAQMLGYITPDRLESLLRQSSEIGRMLTGLREWAKKAKCPNH